METKDKYPWWVRQSLFMMNTRGALVWMQWLSIVTGGVLLILYIKAGAPSDSLTLFLGALMLIIAVLYYLSVRWIDRYGDWNRIREQWPTTMELIVGGCAGLLLGIVVRSII